MGLIEKKDITKQLGNMAEKAFFSDTKMHYLIAIELINKMPEVNAAKIAKLCNEIEDIACHIGIITMNDVVFAESKMIFDKVKEIGKELTGNEAD